MSATTQKLAVGPAPWSKTFQEHVSKLQSPEFVLATLQPVNHASRHASQSGSASAQPPVKTSVAQAEAASPQSVAPRARYCIYRGMWASLPNNKHNDAPRNPKLYDSDMPTFTTDVRMNKVGELFATSPGQASSEDQTQGSGGGGPVEAVWWISEVGTQWRVRGRAFVIDSKDIDNHRGDLKGQVSSGVRLVRSEVGKRMRLLDEGSGDAGTQGDWSWAKEVTGHFGNCSPGMRGTWKNPPPGTPTHGQKPDSDHALGQKVTDLHEKIARDNFRVVVIRPDEVEQTDIKDPEKSRRLLYTFVVDENGAAEEAPEKGEWKVEELWP